MENIKREESRETSGSRQRATLSSYNTLRCTTYTIIKYKNFFSSSSSLSPSLSLHARSVGALKKSLAPNRSKVTTLCFYGAQHEVEGGRRMESRSPCSTSPQWALRFAITTLCLDANCIWRGDLFTLFTLKKPHWLCWPVSSVGCALSSLFSLSASHWVGPRVYIIRTLMRSRVPITERQTSFSLSPSWPPFLVASFDSDDLATTFHEKSEIFRRWHREFRFSYTIVSLSVHYLFRRE